MRWMNRAATTLIVVAVVAGPPALAAGWLHQHPWRTPTRAQLDTWAQQPLTAGTVLAACLTVAAAAWLLLLALLARRALTRLRRRRRPARHLALPTPAQLTAGSLASVAALAAPAATVSHLHTVPAAAGTVPPTGPAESRPDQQAPAAGEGIVLPGGGWIPLPTAAAIAAAAALTWLRRRRHYRPDPGRPCDHRHDPDLQPLPSTVQTVTAALADDGTTPSTTAARAPERLPAGTVQLTGPGAGAAGRGLLIAAALTATGQRPAAGIRMNLDTVRHLLPGADLAALPTAVLLPATDPVAGRRTPAMTCTEAGGRTPSGDRNATPDPLPGAGDTVIVLDDQTPANHRWHVSADGTTTGAGLTEPRRLGILDLQTASDLLTLASRSVDLSTPPADPSAREDHLLTATDQPVSTPAHLRLLGGCELVIAGAPVRLRRTAALQILVYLAVHPGGATATELTRAIWPHFSPGRIAGRLHTTLTDLRRQLRPLLGDEPVTRRETRYLLNPSAVGTDLEIWQSAGRAMSHAVGAAAQQRACRNVVGLYHGELAQGRDWPWLTASREQIRRTVIDACATLADHAGAAEAITWLERALIVDPYNEALHQDTAALLAAAGNKPAAAAVLEALHDRLDRLGGR